MTLRRAVGAPRQLLLPICTVSSYWTMASAGRDAGATIRSSCLFPEV